MNDIDIWESVIEWICTLTGKTTIMAAEGKDRPTKDYLMVNLINTLDVKEHAQCYENVELETLNDEGLPQIESIPVIETEWIFSIHSYSNTDATTCLRKLRAANQNYSSIIRPPEGLNYFDAKQINHINEFVNARYEKRANMKISMRGLTRDGLLINTIDEVSVEVSSDKCPEPKVLNVQSITTPASLIAGLITQDGFPIVTQGGDSIVVEISN